MPSTKHQNIEECEAYKKLQQNVLSDIKNYPEDTRYKEKLKWIVKRCLHYADKTNIPAADILDSWEQARNYWYMNYYQECNMPSISEGSRVHVFDTVDDFRSSVVKPEFRCPSCEGISSDPNVCNSNLKVRGKPCDWKSYGLMRTLGKGVYVFVKDKIKGQEIFTPVSWEKQDNPPPRIEKG